MLVAGGVDGLALLTPGEGDAAPPRVRHLSGAPRDALSLPPLPHARASPQRAPPGAALHAGARGTGSSSGSGAAAMSFVPMGALLAAAGGPAWLVTAHGDAALRVWRLGAPP